MVAHDPSKVEIRVQLPALAWQGRIGGQFHWVANPEYFAARGFESLPCRFYSNSLVV